MRLFLVVLVLGVMASLAAVLVDRSLAEDMGQSALAKAKAAAGKYQVEEAVSLYTKEIDSGRLSTQQLATAYFGRGRAREDYTVAYGIQDSELVLALRDYQKSAEIMPSHAALGSEAYALTMLGAYGEAGEAYRRNVAYEDPPHWSLIGLARIERIHARYDAALKYLDEALRGEPAGTMPLYYHRGWVLFLQEKFADAAKSFSKGLPHQPGYAYAYQFRACANARLGNLKQAVADIEKASDLASAPPVDEAWEATPYGKVSRQDRETYRTIIKAMADGKATTDEDRAKLCKETWNAGERLRPQSPLLSIIASGPGVFVTAAVSRCQNPLRTSDRALRRPICAVGRTCTDLTSPAIVQPAAPCR